MTALDAPPTRTLLDGPGDPARAAAGDRRAFERLYRDHVDRVFTLCARMTADRALAEELTQDVFVRAWEKLALFRGESSFATWLHRLAVNVVLNQREADGRRRRHFAPDDDGDAGERTPTRAAAPGDRMDLERAIATLPPGARRVFVLHDVEGYKHEEIGTLLGITAGGSKAQLHRARLLLREALQA
ncbi:RNA polymerase sigma factor [Gemmatimonadetes bacterium T265]|nr:RNA polymerase sigma factor [Gemmatimonadetes bacterium T265]